jgi:hypothetical protein
LPEAERILVPCKPGVRYWGRIRSGSDLGKSTVIEVRGKPPMQTFYKKISNNFNNMMKKKEVEPF